MPFVVCAGTIAAMGVVAAVIRGDRVMRVGMIGVAATSLPWAICSALSVCTDDPDTATRLLRLGGAPVALVGPSLLLVLLGLSGQLERHRWVARLAGIVGAVLLGLSLGTDWMVPGVHRLRSGVLYASPGPLTDVHVAQLAIWIAVGLVIARRSMMRGERRRMMRVAIAACVLALIAGTDMLLVHDVISGYPVAWLPVTIACGALLYLELATDLLRPRGVDPVAVVELAGLAVATVAIGALAGLLHGAAPIAIAVIASAVWMSVIAIAWGLARGRAPAPVLVADALVRFTAELSDLDDDRPIAAALSALWQHAAIAVRATWRAEPDGLVEVATGARWALDRDLAAWLARHGEPLAAADLATMRLGAIRPKVEALVVERGATLFVPLLDRGALVGLVEADHMLALREAERGLVAESARAAARALTYVELARLAAREGATAREVEVAEAMRRQASASRDAELGPWRVAAEYRSAARTTGAAWSANLLDDGRLAILVTEGQAHGVVAALATAAVTGAFAAATTGGAPSLDDLLAILRTSAERVLHGERIAAFVAIASAETQAISWACAGHPGAFLVEQGAETQDPRLLGGGGARLGDPSGDPSDGPSDRPSDGPSDRPSDRVMRGEAPFGPDLMLVVASTGVRGSASRAWYGVLCAHRAAGSRLAALLVDAVADHGTASEDLLAVVIRSRGDVERGECRSGTLSGQGVP